MSAAAAKQLDRDPTVYPIEDDVGEGSLQRFISELLRTLIAKWVAERGQVAFVGADQFFYWEQYNPSEGIAPDVYVLPGVAPETRVGAWKVWETKQRPSFAFEVVSQDIQKDYLGAPAKYGRLGVNELVVFDPDYHESPQRIRWQVFRRTTRGFLREESTNDDRVYSERLGCWLRIVGEGNTTRVRLATGPEGEHLFPTDAEARAAAEARQRQLETEQRALHAALASEQHARAALEAELTRLRGRRDPTPVPTSTERPTRRKKR
ncbi:Uma2 family endonuclease [Chondromyces apiculatus]|uniref:Putative restriction endonuclease domain-containing protein n=1 Tax=Chondromyces apiculatus DSM 436 TaxID=1192034 RepID=A0A017TFG5_9BACT|nr:Uma2 family endonuclease [Chondromyces apiculatus]EYF07984.1 Hypothetical protein CAP_7006 [Chondromyces apiculatus DSM 436]